MSDTPRSDSTPHNVADLGMLCRVLERLASVRLDYINQLEANNDAVTSEVERLTNKVAQLYEGAEEQKQRIKRLEEAGGQLMMWIGEDISDSNRQLLEDHWNKAKGAKP